MNFFKFLFVGPLPSLLQQFQEELRMTLRQELSAFNDRIVRITDELRSDIQSLNDRLANVPVPEDVSDLLQSINANLTALEGLDQPNLPSPGEPVEENPEPTPEPEPEPETEEPEQNSEPVSE